MACNQSTLFFGTSFFSQLYFPSSGRSTNEILGEIVASAPFLCHSRLRRSRALARLASLAQIRELPRRLNYLHRRFSNPGQLHRGFKSHFNLMLDLLQGLRFTIDRKKSRLLDPNQSLSHFTFLGVSIKSLTMLFSLPEKKILTPPHRLAKWQAS